METNTIECQLLGLRYTTLLANICTYVVILAEITYAMEHINIKGLTYLYSDASVLFSHVFIDF